MNWRLSFFRRVGIPEPDAETQLRRFARSPAPVTLSALKEYVAPFLSEFSDEGKARFENNPLRLLDTKSPRELTILADAPQLPSYLADDEAAHFTLLCEYLGDAGVAYQLDPYLVRGFDYYTKTAFEIQSDVEGQGAQNALGGGGRYNRLVEEIGGPATPGIGFGLGVERILIALQALGVEMPAPRGPMAFIVTQGQAARPIGVGLLARLRAAGITAGMEYGDHSTKAQMRAANRARARYALILGDDELSRRRHPVQEPGRQLAAHGPPVRSRRMVRGQPAAQPLSQTIQPMSRTMPNALPVFARWLHTIAFGLWLGGLLAIGALVAPEAFAIVRLNPATDNPALQAQIAGGIVGGSLRHFNFLCDGCGALMLVANALLWPRLSRAGRTWAASVLLVTVVLLGTSLYQGFGLFPAMDAAQAQGNKALFDGLHLRYERLSTQLQFPLLLVLALLSALRDTACAAPAPPVRGS